MVRANEPEDEFDLSKETDEDIEVQSCYEFGIELGHALEAFGGSLSQIAKATGYTKSYLSQLLYGKNISIAKAGLLLHRLGFRLAITAEPKQCPVVRINAGEPWGREAPRLTEYWDRRSA